MADLHDTNSSECHYADIICPTFNPNVLTIASVGRNSFMPLKYEQQWANFYEIWAHLTDFYTEFLYLISWKSADSLITDTRSWQRDGHQLHLHYYFSILPL